MSNNIDDRIVQMQFNNREFERNIEQSSKSLEKFNEQLKFKDAKRGVKDLEATVRSMNLDSLKSAVDSLEHHFTDVFERLRVRVVDRFLDDMTSKFTQLIKRMTITPISAGWKKYEENTQSVQTIMAATGKSIDEVQAQMEKLMWFTDETSYSFVDMTSNIGKFTGAGVDLETAVTAMQGIATWAALSGQNAQGASRAMYNLSQALGQGAVTAIDWKSIQNVNMDTLEFKQRVIDAAKALGKLNKQGKTAKGTLVTAENFYGTLSEKWFTSDVLLKVLGEFGEFADTMYEETRHGAIPASEAMAKYGSGVKSVGERAFRAAQEAKTLTDALSSVDDATSTSWMKTWELIFGNYEEAKVLFTDLANLLWDIFNADNAIRNEALKIWHDLDKNENGRLDALQAVYDIIDSIRYAAGKAREAIDSIFPNDADTQLGMFKSITAQMVEASKTVRELLGYEEEITTSQTSAHHAFVEPFDDALKRGMRGEGVKEMQRRLEELGYSVGSAGVDGIFGPDTEAALKKFQKESQLLDPKHITLGFYDAQTQMALVSAAAGDVAVEVHSTSETVEHIGTYTEKIQTITKGIASVFSIIGKILNFGWSVIKLIVKTLAPAGNGLLTIIAAIAESFTSLNNTLSGDNPFAKWLDDIEKKLEPVRAKIESVTNSVLAFFGLTPKLDENGEALATNDEELMTFSKLWENVRTNLEESGALDRLSAAFENLKASIETIKATIKTWWNTLTESLGEKASENLTKLWDKMPSIAETVVNALTSVITWLGDKAGKVPDAINSVITWFTNLYTTLKESETLKKVGARLRAAFESIKKAFNSISPNASKWLESIKIMLFGGGEESEQKGLAGRLQDTIPSIIEKVGNALASALEFFSQVIENIPNNVTKIKDFFIDVYNGLKESETVKSILGTVQSVFESIGGILASIWGSIVNFLTGGGDKKSSATEATRTVSRTKHSRKRAPIVQEVDSVETTMNTVSETAETIKGSVEKISETIDSAAETVNGTLGTINGLIEQAQTTADTVLGGSGDYSFVFDTINGLIQGSIPSIEGAEGSSVEALHLIDGLLGISTDAELSAEEIESALSGVEEYLTLASEMANGGTWKAELPEGFEEFANALMATNANAETATETTEDTRTFIEKVGDGFKGILDALAPWAIGIGAQVTTMNALQTAKSVPKSINNILNTIATIKYGPKAMQSESRTTKFLKIAGSIALLGGAIYLIARSISIIGKMKPDELKRGGLTVAIIIGVLTGLSAAIGAMGKAGRFGSLKDITTGVGGAIVAVLGIVAAIWLLSKMKEEDIIKGGIVMGAILAFLGILYIVTNLLTKKKSTTINGMQGIWGIAAIILALTAALWLIGNMRLGVILKGITGIIAIAVALRIFMKSLGNAAGTMSSKDAKWGWLIGLSLLILILTKTVSKLGSMDFFAMAQGLIGLGVVLFAAAKTIKSITKSVSGFGSKGVFTTILGMVLLIGSMVWALVRLSNINTESLIASGAVLATIMLLVSKMIKNTSALKVEKGNKTALAGILVSFGGIILLMWSLFGIIKLLEGVDPKLISTVASAIKGILFAVAVVMEVVNHPGKHFSTASPLKSFLGTLGQMGAIFIALAALIGTLMILTNFKWFNNGMVRVATSIGEFAGTIAGTFLAAKFKSFATNINAYATEVGAVKNPGSLTEKTEWAISIAKSIQQFEDGLDGAEGAVSIGGSVAAILQGVAGIVFYESMGSFGTNLTTFVDAIKSIPESAIGSEENPSTFSKKVDFAIAVADQIAEFTNKLTDGNHDGAKTLTDVAAGLITQLAAAIAFKNISGFGKHFSEFATEMKEVPAELTDKDMETKVQNAVTIAGYVADFATGLNKNPGIAGAADALLNQFTFGSFIKNLGNFGQGFQRFVMYMTFVPDPDSILGGKLDERTKWAVQIAESVAALAKGFSGGGDLEAAVSEWVGQFTFGHFITNLGNFGSAFKTYVSELATLGEELATDDKTKDIDFETLRSYNEFAVEIAAGVRDFALALGDSDTLGKALASFLDQKTFGEFIENVPKFGEMVSSYGGMLGGLFEDQLDPTGLGIPREAMPSRLDEFRTTVRTNSALLHDIVNDIMSIPKSMAVVYAKNGVSPDLARQVGSTLSNVIDFVGNDKKRGGLVGYINAIKNFGATSDISEQAGYASAAFASITALIDAASAVQITKSGHIGALEVVGTETKFNAVLGMITSFSTTLSSNSSVITSLSNDSDLAKGLTFAISEIIRFMGAVDGLHEITSYSQQSYISSMTSFMGLLGTLGESINQFVMSTKTISDTEMDSALAAIDSIYTTVSEHVLGTATGIIDGIKESNSEAISTLGAMLGLTDESEMAVTAKDSGKAVANAYVTELISTLQSQLTSTNVDTAITFVSATLKSRLEANGPVFAGVGSGIGSQFTYGFGFGILSKKAVAFVQVCAAYVGNKAKESLKDSVGVASPSKVAAEIGMFFDMGLANGITNNVGLVTTAANKLGDGVTKASNEVFSAVVQALNEGVDYDPVIRPVLDLSNVRAGANTMNSLLGNRTFGLTSAELANRVASSGAIGRNANFAESLKSVNDRLDNLGEAMTHLKVVMNSGVIAGEIAPEIDKNLGKVISRKGRG